MREGGVQKEEHLKVAGKEIDDCVLLTAIGFFLYPYALRKHTKNVGFVLVEESPKQKGVDRFWSIPILFLDAHVWWFHHDSMINIGLS